MEQALVQGLRSIFDPGIIGFVVLGVLLGIVIGVIPGIDGFQGLVLFLPFVFYLPKEQALACMVGLSSACLTGGAITAVLLGIPGDVPNAATIMDGYAMTRKGEGGRALGAALVSSGLAGIVAVIFALAMMGLVRPIVTSITSGDLVFLILLGIAFIGVLGKGSMVKGLISGGLGLLVSFIGLQISTGIPRFTFGITYLFEGVDLVPVGLGLFAIPEMIMLATTGSTVAIGGVAIKGMKDVWRGVRDVFRHWWLFLRSAVIGYVVGIIPAVGAGTSVWVAYGQAKASSKHPEKFGTGTVEGVIAPQSAANGVDAGALLTTLSLGIPGSAMMAVILGGFLILGLQPGPAMLNEQLNLSVMLILVVGIGNVLTTILALFAAPYIARVSTVAAAILVPLILVLVFAGTFVSRQHFNDLVMLLIFGALGLGMRSYGYNPQALFLGFMLGGLFEHYFFLAVKTAGPLFFLRPVSLVLIFLLVATFSFGPIRNMVVRRSRKGAEQA